MDEETARALRPSERLGNYFVVVGDKNTEKHPEPLPEHQLQKYITDVVVVNPKYDELTCRYELVTKELGGERLNLKASQFMRGKLFLAVEYNGSSLPITGITLCNLENLPENYTPITETPSGKDASICTIKKKKYYISVERKEESKYFVTAISITCPGKKEVLPEHYRRCDVPLYKSLTYQRHNVYLAYELLNQEDQKVIYKAEVLDRYPKEDYEDCPLIANAANFCLPEGLQVELFDIRHVPMPKWYPFVLTESSGRRIYGASLVFWEPILNKEAKDTNLSSLYKQSNGDDETVFMLLHKTKCICIMSHHPFFSAYKKVLQFLYRISLGKNQKMPIERYISHLLGEVTSPKPNSRHIVDWRLGANNTIIFERPGLFQLPLVDLSFLPLFHMLDATNVAKLLYLFMSEKKVLLSSIHMPILCYVAEAVRSLMFPLDYQGVYIPMCSHELYAVLDAPVPFVVGMNSNYVKRLSIPTDVWIIDLDSNSMYCSGVENSKDGPTEFMEITAVKDFVKGMEYYLNDAGVKADGNPDVINAFQSSQEAMLASSLNLSVDGIRNEALKMMMAFLRHYRNHLKIEKGRIKNLGDMFDTEGFIAMAIPEHQSLLAEMMPTQTFGAFVQERTFPSNNSPCFVFFDQCLDLSPSNGEDASPVLLEIQIEKLMESGARNVHATLKRRLSLGLSKAAKKKEFEGPSYDKLPKGIMYDYDDYWPKLDHSLFLPDFSNVSDCQVIHGSEKIAARTEGELINSLQGDKSTWYFGYMHSSDVLKIAQAKVKSLLKHFYGMYGLCLVSSLALLKKLENNRESVADKEKSGIKNGDGNDISSFQKQKEELYESLVDLWGQLKDGQIILDEAGYRALMVACSYFYDDGKKIAEEIYAMIKEFQDGKVSALTYSQYTRVRTMPSNADETARAGKEKKKIAESPLKTKFDKSDIEPKSWLLMWSQQSCPSCEYSYSDEQILNRFEDSGLARTISCPCCGESLEPNLFFRTYISSSVLDDMEVNTQQTKKFSEKSNVDPKCEPINVPRQTDSAPAVSADSIQILDTENSTIVTTVENDVAQDISSEKKLVSSRSMSMQDKLKIVRSSLIFSTRTSSGVDIEVLNRKRSSTLKHATSMLDKSNVDDNWVVRPKRVESSFNMSNGLEADQKNRISKYRGTVTGGGCSNCSVSYLSLIRLRTELEKVLSIEGHNGFERSRLRLRHQKLYYNLIWYCSRLNLKLPLCLDSLKNRCLKTWTESIKFSHTSLHGKHTIPGYGANVFSLRSYEEKLKSNNVLPARRRALTKHAHVRTSQKEFLTSGDEDVAIVNDFLNFSKDIKERKRKWYKETVESIRNGYHEDSIISFLKLRMDNKLVWPEVKKSIYNEMREMHAKDSKLNGEDPSDSSEIYLTSTHGKPPNAYAPTQFDVNFEKAVNWLSPHYREELAMQDACGCNASLQLIRHTFGALW